MKINLIENHEYAYYLWKKNNFVNQTVVHIDAHIDIMPDSFGNIHLGNFLFQAIKDGIVKKLFWVIPGNILTFDGDFIILKKLISMLASYEAGPQSKNGIITYTNGIIKTVIFGVPLVICTLASLPYIKEPILLDIDVDYFVIDSVRKNSNLDSIGRRKQWIDIRTFMKSVSSVITNYNFLTIAYSVNGGYTPLPYKTIGDELAKAFRLLDNQLDQRLIAGKYFKKFRDLFDKNNLSEAKKYFFAALNLDSSYSIQENTYGELYLRLKNLIKAKGEFSKMLKINSNDIHCLIGMGIVCIYDNKITKARMYFNQVFTVDPQNWLGPFYLALIEYKFKNYSQSKILALIAENLNVTNFYPKYLLAKLLALSHKPYLSMLKYQEALQVRSLNSIPFGLEVLME